MCVSLRVMGEGVCSLDHFLVVHYFIFRLLMCKRENEYSIHSLHVGSYARTDGHVIRLVCVCACVCVCVIPN